MWQQDFLSVEVFASDSVTDLVGYVSDGTPCGDADMCVNQQCVSVTETCACPEGIFCDQYGFCHQNSTNSPSARPSNMPSNLPSATTLPSNSPSHTLTNFPSSQICIDRDDELLEQSGNLYSSCSEFVSGFGQENCDSNLFNFNAHYMCCHSCNESTVVEPFADCGLQGYVELPLQFKLDLQYANYSLVSLSPMDIFRLCHNGDGQLVFKDDNGKFYDTCIGYGSDGCDSTEVVCSGTDRNFGTAQQILHELDTSLENYYRHPTCPKGCFIQDSYDGLYDFRNCTGDGLYDCYAECLGIGTGGNFICLQDGSSILNDDSHGELPCTCQDREGYWDLCADAKADPTMCEFYGPGYCPATCGLCKNPQYYDCAPEELSSDYWNLCTQNQHASLIPGGFCTVVCLLDGVTDRLFCPLRNVMPNAPLQPQATGQPRISPSECVTEVETTESPECVDIVETTGSESLCQAALLNPEVHCVEGSTVRRECPDSCGLCPKHCSPFVLSSDSPGTYDISDCESELLAGDSCFVQCASNRNLLSEFSCPADAQNGDVLVGELPSCWFCDIGNWVHDPLYEHNCPSLAWAGGSCTVSCANDVVQNSEIWECPAELDEISPSIFAFPQPMLGALPDCTYCQALSLTSREDIHGCEEDLAPGESCYLSCVVDDSDPKIVTCPEDASLIGQMLQVEAYPVCDRCDPLVNIDPLLYDITDCNRTLQADQTCHINCLGLALPPVSFTCKAGDTTLDGEWPTCRSCAAMSNTNALYESSECESVLAEGDFCSVRCASEPNVLSAFQCQPDGSLQGNFPNCGQCAPLDFLNETIYDVGGCSESLQAGENCVVTCASSLKANSQQFFCPIDANTTSHPLVGTAPDCFFCSPPEFDSATYISTCSQTQNSGSECHIICRNNADLTSSFYCPDSISSTNHPMTGSFKDCVQETFELSGLITGLDGTITLTLNGDNARAVTSVLIDASFLFVLEANSSYVIEIEAQPTGQICEIFDGSGTIREDFSNIRITCEYERFRISGRVTGLFGALVLSNLGEEITLQEDGAFEFPTEVAYRSPYEISIVTAVEDMRCELSFHTGIVTGEVSNIAVACEFDGLCASLDLDDRIYSGCDTETRASESCDVKCQNGGQIQSFQCPSDSSEGLLVGDLPQCEYCERMASVGPTIETNCTQEHLFIGDSCIAECSQFYSTESEPHTFEFTCTAHESGNPQIHDPGIDCHAIQEEDVQAVVAVFPHGKIVFSKLNGTEGVQISVQLFGEGTYIWSLSGRRDSPCESSEKIFDPWVSTPPACKTGDFTCQFGNISSSHEFVTTNLSVIDVKSRQVMLNRLPVSSPGSSVCASALHRDPEVCTPLEEEHINFLITHGLNPNHTSSLCSKPHSETSAISEMFLSPTNGERVASCVVSTTNCDLLSSEERVSLLCFSDYPMQVRYLNNIIGGGAPTCEPGLTTVSPNGESVAEKTREDDSLLFGLDTTMSLIVLGVGCLLLLCLIFFLIRCGFQKRRLEHKRATLIKQQGGKADALPNSPNAPSFDFGDADLPNSPKPLPISPKPIEQYPGMAAAPPRSVIEMSNFPGAAGPRDSFKNEDAFTHTPGMPPSAARPSLRQSQRGSRFNIPDIDNHGGGEFPDNFKRLPKAPGIPQAPHMPHLHTEPPFTPLMPHVLDHPDAAKPAAPDQKRVEFLEHKRSPDNQLRRNPLNPALGRGDADGYASDGDYSIEEGGDNKYSDEEGGFPGTMPSKNAFLPKDPDGRSYSFI